MSRVNELFDRKKQNILNIYFTAGFPALNDTLVIIKALQDEGVDMVEIGMPYSDPLADGPVIQSSSTKALANGMTIRKLFDQLRDFRKTIQLPVLLMGYMNPILQFGFDKFCREAAEIGVDGLILPDLPVFEFEKEFGIIISKYNLDFIFLVTPETEETRIRILDQQCKGFLYAVSSSSTTGQNVTLDGQKNYFSKLASMGLKNPVLIGFGIKDKSSFLKACEFGNGAIIGTAFIRALENATADEVPLRTKNFINSLK